jgi:hypothetical protein
MVDEHGTDGRSRPKNPGRDPHAEPKGERERYEQMLMRVGRKLQSTGQLLEQAPARIVGKGFASDPAVTGDRPVQIDLDELKEWFDAASPRNVGKLLQEYHDILARRPHSPPDR